MTINWCYLRPTFLMPHGIMRLPSSDSIASELSSSSPVRHKCRPSPATPWPVAIELSVSATQGGRRYMEDRLHVECARTVDGRVDHLFLGVFDGHGGSEASQFASEHLRKQIISKPYFHNKDDESVLRAIKEGFSDTHLAMWKNSESWARTISGYSSTSGTTASIAIVKNGKLYTGHAGDSAIVMGHQEKISLPGDCNEKIVVRGQKLTVDHKPDNENELRRILDTGGQVASKSGVARVVWNRPNKNHGGPVRRSTSMERVPFLAVSRSLGDLWSYNASMDRFVVSPEPDIACFPLDENCVSLTIGSDGLWNVLKPGYATEVIRLAGFSSESKFGSPQVSPYPHVNYARLLVSHALTRWGKMRADNISAITVRFLHNLDEAKIQNSQQSESSCSDDIVCEHPDLDINAVLTVCPSNTVILIDDHTTRALKASKIDLQYTGCIDENYEIPTKAPFSAADQSKPCVFRGPGYQPVSHASSDSPDDHWSAVGYFPERRFLRRRDNFFYHQSNFVARLDDRGDVIFSAVSPGGIGPLNEETSRVTLIDQSPNVVRANEIIRENRENTAMTVSRNRQIIGSGLDYAMDAVGGSRDIRENDTFMVQRNFLTSADGLITARDNIQAEASVENREKTVWTVSQGQQTIGDGSSIVTLLENRDQSTSAVGGSSQNRENFANCTNDSVTFRQNHVANRQDFDGQGESFKTPPKTVNWNENGAFSAAALVTTPKRRLLFDGSRTISSSLLYKATVSRSPYKLRSACSKTVGKPTRSVSSTRHKAASISAHASAYRPRILLPSSEPTKPQLRRQRRLSSNLAAPPPSPANASLVRRRLQRRLSTKSSGKIDGTRLQQRRLSAVLSSSTRKIARLQRRLVTARPID